MGKNLLTLPTTPNFLSYLSGFILAMATVVNFQCDKRNPLLRLQHLLNNPQMSDIEFIFYDKKSSKKTIYAHSWVLSMSSANFYGTLKGNFEVKQTITITDVSYDAFYQLIYCFYTGHFKITQSTAMDLLLLAKRYDVHYLEEDCVKFLKDNLTANNVCSMLERSKSLSLTSLLVKCNEFLQTNLKAVFDSSTFTSVNYKTLQVLVATYDVKCSEVDKFDACIHWATAECQRTGKAVSGANKRMELNGIHELIRFTKMNAIEFSKCITEIGFFTDTEISSTFVMIATNSVGGGGIDGKKISASQPQQQKKGNKSKETKAASSTSQRNKSSNLQVDLNTIPAHVLRVKGIAITHDPKYHAGAMITHAQFSVNKKIVITGIGVLGLSDSYNITIKRNNGTTVGKPQQSGHNRFPFPIIIDVHAKYFIDIEYLNITSSIFYDSEGSYTPFTTTENCINFNFSKANSALQAIYYKIYP